MGPGYVPCNATLRRGLKEADLVILLGHHFEFDLDFGRTRVKQHASSNAWPTRIVGQQSQGSVGAIASPSAFVGLLEKTRQTTFDRSWMDG